MAQGSNGLLLAYQAALEVIGVAIAERVLVHDDLASGRLVTPFAFPLELGEAYYLVSPRARSERPMVAAFRAWLTHELSREA